MRLAQIEREIYATARRPIAAAVRLTSPQIIARVLMKADTNASAPRYKSRFESGFWKEFCISISIPEKKK
jgi:hypothetical protein